MAKRFVDKTRKHCFLFLLEVMATGGDVGFRDDDRIIGHLRFQWDGIATTRHANRLWINRSRAVLADHSM